MSVEEGDWMCLCESGDPIGYIAQATDDELRKLEAHVTNLQRRNERKGGWPACVQEFCRNEAAKRFLKQP